MKSNWLNKATILALAIATSLPAAHTYGANPSVPLAAQPPSAAGVAGDVALQAGGVLRGQIVNAQGLPIAGVTVSAWQNDRHFGQCVTTETGEFAIADLRGGIYQVRAGQSATLYRLWANNTAPPSAHTSVLLVDGLVVRGQLTGGSFLRSPWTWGILLGAAICTPIALANNDPKPGS